jgi:GNAT superfamily N-acetyltransferase
VLPPGDTDITPDKAEKGGLGDIPALLGEDAAARFFSVMDFLDPFHKIDAAEPHWYTMVIGVDPAFCGLGYGKALMQHVMAKAQNHQSSMYLETAQPSNILIFPFIQTLGSKYIGNLQNLRANFHYGLLRRSNLLFNYLANQNSSQHGVAAIGADEYIFNS